MTGLEALGLSLLVLALASVLGVLWVVMDRHPEAHASVPYAGGVAVLAALVAFTGGAFVALG